MFKTMNSSYLREIPLRILNRKIGDEHVTLLQACYDNPIFNEEDGKRVPQQNGGTAEKAPGNPDYLGVEVCNNSHDSRARGYSAGHVASEYMHSLPPTSPTSNDITFRGHRKRKRRCILCTICMFVALVVGIGLLIYLLEEDKSSNTKTPSSPAKYLLKFEVNLTLKGGPFSQYHVEYGIPNTDSSKLFRRAFLFKISDVFLSSDLSSIYNKTKIVRISNANGRASLTFIIQPPPHVTCSHDCEARITNLLLKGLEDSLFIVDRNSVSVKMYYTPPPPTIPSGCLPITFNALVNRTGYSSWVPPNVMGHRTNQEVNSYLSKIRPLLNDRCYYFTTQFYSAAFFPKCPSPGGSNVFPCKQYCIDVKSSCQKDYEEQNLTMPFQCDIFQDSENPDMCIQSPFTPGKCVANPFEECLHLGLNKTAFPNVVGINGIEGNISANNFQFMYKMQQATHCYKHIMLFTCAVFAPPCSGKEPPNHYVPPCRGLCQNFKDRCEIFLDMFEMTWPTSVANCSAFPDSPDPNVCTGYHESREPDDKVCFKDQVECADASDTCINKDWFCDGEQDCPNNTDEKHCAKCGVDQEQCSPTTSLCIAKEKGCDGINDCYGNTDETYCVRLDPSVKSNRLQVRNPLLNNRWEEVCEDGWNNDFSNMTCRNLGYKMSAATYFTVQSNNSLKAMVSSVKNGSDPTRLQSYINKGLSSCPSGRVVQLLCWEVACGVRPAHVSSPLRVLGGDEVVPGTWPWMVSLHGGTGLSFFCAGSIIADDWVLTAAHCVGGADRDTRYWTLKTGNTRRDVYSEYRQIRKPKKLFRHPQFHIVTVEHDIALIQLEHPFKFNDHVRAICLPDEPTISGTRCILSGWGKSRLDALHYERSLRQVTVDVTSWGHCYIALHEKSHTNSPYELKKSMFCAGGANKHDSCQGDSGGPLVCRKPNTTDEWYQSGITSWGIKCGLRNVPGVYTNVTRYVDWIKDIIKNNTKNTDGKR